MTGKEQFRDNLKSIVAWYRKQYGVSLEDILLVMEERFIELHKEEEQHVANGSNRPG